MQFISDSVKYIGTDDKDLDLFEGQYIIPNGISYNSYLIIDEKIAVMDTVDSRKTKEWLENLENALEGRTPDYLVISHLEPDHAGSIKLLAEKYPQITLIGNAKTFAMLPQFFDLDEGVQRLTVKEGDTVSLGSHELTFVMAPMVHWPEVMVTYDNCDRVLFSADAFGKFGAQDVQQEWAEEAGRYYFGIVGKYGAQVQMLLKKAAKLDIQKICPLHGPVLQENLGYYLNLYNIWSSYEPEKDGIVIAYTSVYGHTKKAAQLLADQLRESGCEQVVVYDLARCDMAKAVADAFRFNRLVLATTTYNAGIYPFMREFIEHLTERGFQNRTVALIENGSWAPMAAKGMKELLSGCKNLTFTETSVSIKSALNQESTEQIKALAEELTKMGAEVNENQAEESVQEEEAQTKKFVCKICGYIYEGAELPEGFTCPICKHGAEFFEPME